MAILETFRVRAESGWEATAHKIGHDVPHASGGRRRTLLGGHHFKLDDGTDLNEVRGDPGAFKVVLTDEIVRKID